MCNITDRIAEIDFAIKFHLTDRKQEEDLRSEKILLMYDKLLVSSDDMLSKITNISIKLAKDETIAIAK